MEEKRENLENSKKVEEKKDSLENSKKINQLFKDNTLGVEFGKVREFTNEVYREISKKAKGFNDRRKQEEAQKQENARKAEAEKIAEEARKALEAQKLAEEKARLQEEARKAEEEQKRAKEEAIKAEEIRIAEENKKIEESNKQAAEEKPQEKVEEKPEIKVEEPKKPVDEVKVEEKPTQKQEEKVELKKEDKKEVKAENKPETKVEDKPQEPQKPVIIKTDNPNIVIINGKRVFVPNARREVNNNNNNNNNQNRNNNRPNNGERKPFDKNNKPGFNKPNNQNGQRPNGQNGGQQQKDKSFNLNAPTFVPKDNNQKTKKKVAEKSYDDKKVINKKSLVKGQSVIDDYNEDMTGVRKIRKVKEKKVEVKEKIKVEKAVITKEIIAIKELSELIGVQAVEITKILFKEGVMKTINDTIDYDTAGFIAAGLGIELELKLGKTAEEMLTEVEAEDESLLEKRPPVVTVMGHVDHGKTSLLDYIRHTSVTAGEAGGITQHIGAYTVNLNGEKITFLDTPGHAAFTAMRARGAQLTDIAIIVVAADDGIMPQTIEAIHHAKAAGVSIIIAANKIDKPTIDLERVKKELADQEVLIEDWGGDVPFIPVSAKTGAGIDSLLETILLTAEMKELKANPNKMARGAIVEAKLDKGKGPVATVLVQAGTLKVGDYLVAGTSTGKVRAMIDDKGKMIQKAGPSTPVSVLGLDEVPNAGDSIFAVEEAKMSTLVAEERRNKEKEEMIKNQQKVSLDELFSKVSTGDLKNLNIIVKADVQGSVEAVKQSLGELSNEEVKVNVIHAQVGAISETDVSLADSSNSIIIGFNVRPDSKAKELAERSKVDIKLYRIIYEAIEDIKAALNGMLNPKYEDKYQGKAEVRETFKISNVGTVAGCYVVDGKILRSGKLRIYRNDIMICEGNVLQLKRFKDDVKEVAQGYECGMSIEKFDDIKIGDFIECYTTEKVN